MDKLKHSLASALEEALDKKLSEHEIFELLEIPPSPSLGDFAFPCYSLSKELKKSPDQIVKDIAEKMMVPEGFEKLHPAGPYLNFFIAKEEVAKHALEDALAQKDKYGFSDSGKGERYMVEYSGPNSNKPLHLGHLRNNSVGMSVAKIFEANGYDIVKANLINDRGIHICKSMLAYQLFGEGKTPQTEKKKPDHFVGDYYILYNQKVGQNQNLEKQAYDLLKKWEQMDKPTVGLWKKMANWALDGFKQTYNAFGSEFDIWFYESDFYNKAGPVLELGAEKGIFKENKEGALVAQLESHGLPDKTVLRADGTSIYITNDLALTKHKFEEFKLVHSLWVVGSEQDLYFRQLFKIFELLGFGWAKNCKHLSHGMVNLPSGKLKSREGKVVDADEIIAQMEQLASQEIKKRQPDLNQKEIDRRSVAIGLAAIKFHMLKIAVQKDILFDPKKSISFEGETGPYIQYTYARAKSIVRKANNPKIKQIGFERLIGPEEQRLLKLLANYPEAVKKSLEQMSPHIICQTLIEVAEAFNSFYHAHKVLKAGSEEIKTERIALVEATAQVIKNGLWLLDIEAIEEM